MPIPRVHIAPNGPEFSQMVYGTWRVLDEPAASAQELNRRIHLCLELGMTTLDTAERYGLYEAEEAPGTAEMAGLDEVEEALGKALALSPGLRDKLEIVTKAGIYVPCSYQPERKVAHYTTSAARLVKSTEKSLRLLGTDRVELFLVHR